MVDAQVQRGVIAISHWPSDQRSAMDAAAAALGLYPRTAIPRTPVDLDAFRNRLRVRRFLIIREVLGCCGFDDDLPPTSLVGSMVIRRLQYLLTTFPAPLQAPEDDLAVHRYLRRHLFPSTRYTPTPHRHATPLRPAG
jgi:hypothetical protein